MGNRRAARHPRRGTNMPPHKSGLWNSAQLLKPGPCLMLGMLNENGGVLRTVRAGVMRISEGAGSRLGLAPDGVHILDDECRDVLKMLAENGAADG